MDELDDIADTFKNTWEKEIQRLTKEKDAAAAVHNNCVKTILCQQENAPAFCPADMPCPPSLHTRAADGPVSVDREKLKQLKDLITTTEQRISALQSQISSKADLVTKVAAEKTAHKQYKDLCTPYLDLSEAIIPLPLWLKGEREKKAQEEKEAKKAARNRPVIEDDGSAPRPTFPEVIIDVKDYRGYAHDTYNDALDEITTTGDTWHTEITRGQPPSIVADCTIGVCYRPKEPYRINYGIRTGEMLEGIKSRIVELPNRSPLIALDIRRAFLVTKVTTIEFDTDGFLKHVHVNKPSEMLAAAQLPLAVVDALAKGFQFRASIISKQRSVAEKEIALLKAQTALGATQAATPARAALESGVPLRPGFRSSGAKSFARSLPNSNDAE